MLETVTAYIEQYQLLPVSGEILVAVSGGADSLCLLHLLHRLCGPGKRYPQLKLHVAHLNHKLRGEGSAEDAAYVEQLAANWGLRSTIGEVDVPALAREERRSLEEAARTARYRFLRAVAQRQPIAVAHHADDQVETLLLHWLRGSGISGMVGMLPRQQDILRPLLAVTHAETVAYCGKYGLVPLEDASNSDPQFVRNRIRHELLPLLETLNPGFRATLLRNAEVIRPDVAWIEAQVDQCWPSVVRERRGGESPASIKFGVNCSTSDSRMNRRGRFTVPTADVSASEATFDPNVEISSQDSARLNVSALLTLPLSLQRHLLRRVTAELCAGQSPLELRHVLLIEHLLQQESGGEERALNLPGHLQVSRHSDEIVFTRSPAYEPPQPFSLAEEAIPLPIPGHVAVKGTPWIASAELVTGGLAGEVQHALERQNWPEVWRLLPVTRYTVYIDLKSVGPGLWVRTRRPGDRIRPLGMAEEKKVQDVLVNKHIARAERASIPIFFSETHCLWVAGVQLDDRARLTCETQQIVRLAIEPGP